MRRWLGWIMLVLIVGGVGGPALRPARGQDGDPPAERPWRRSAEADRPPRLPPNQLDRPEQRPERDAPPGREKERPERMLRDGPPGPKPAPRAPDFRGLRPGDRLPPDRGAAGDPLAEGPGRPGAPGPGPFGAGPRGVGPFGGNGPMAGLGGGYAPGPYGAAPMSDPEMEQLSRKDLELGQRSMQLANEYRLAPDQRKEELWKQLDEVVAEHFKTRQQRRELQLQRLEEQLNQLRKALEQRTELREQIIKKHVAELIGEVDPLDF